MQKLPAKISPCPIEEAIFEYRFKTEIPGDAMFGILYKELKNEFPDIESLDILQLPKSIREEESLKYSPHYKMTNGKISILIGPSVISIVNHKEYFGWSEFSKVIQGKIFKANELIGVQSGVRLSLRYINVFKNEDIFKKANIKLLLDTNQFVNSNANFSSKIFNGDLTTEIRVVSGAKIDNKKQEPFVGSIIDVTTSVSSLKDKDFEQTLESAHDEEKRIFYMFIGNKMLENLEVEY